MEEIFLGDLANFRRWVLYGSSWSPRECPWVILILDFLPLFVSLPVCHEVGTIGSAKCFLCQDTLLHQGSENMEPLLNHEIKSMSFLPYKVCSRYFVTTMRKAYVVLLFIKQKYVLFTQFIVKEARKTMTSTKILGLTPKSM